MLAVLVATFSAMLIIANILANVMLQLGPWTISAGVLAFPITYILSDVFSEVYGFKWSRRVTWIACSLNLVFATLVKLAIALPHPVWFDVTPFALGIGSTWRIVLASIASFAVGDFVNDMIFRSVRTKSYRFSISAVTSSFGGEIVDSAIFCLLAFWGTMPAQEIIPMIVLQVLVKTGYEITILPVTCQVALWVGKHEKIHSAGFVTPIGGHL